MDRTLALPQNTFVLFLLLNTLTIVPSISFIIFTLLSKPPLITKQVEQSGWTLIHVGCNANIQNHEMREPIATAVQASHYTTLPLPFAFAFQYPQYINHFPFVSSLCQSESQHTSSTSSPKTLTKQKTITNPRHHWTQPHLSFAPSHSDPQFGSPMAENSLDSLVSIAGLVSTQSTKTRVRIFRHELPPVLDNPGSSLTPKPCCRIQILWNAKVESMCNTSENSRLTWVALHKSHGFPVLYNLTQLCLNTHFKYCSQG